MRESRIKRNIIILLAVAFLLLIGLVLGWFFVLVRPQQQALADISTQYEGQLATANKLQQTRKEQRKAEDRLKAVNGQFNFLRQKYRNFYFGEIGQDYQSETPVQKANRETIWRNLMNYYYNGYGPALQKELQDYATASGVHIVSSIAVITPPNKPEDVAPPATGLLKPVAGGANAGSSAPTAGAPGSASSSAPAGDTSGSMNVTVDGPLPNILRYFDALNNNATLVKVGTIKLDTIPGNPVRVRATFTLTPYLLSTGPGAPIAENGAGAGGATSPVGNPANPTRSVSTTTTTRGDG